MYSFGMLPPLPPAMQFPLLARGYCGLAIRQPWPAIISPPSDPRDVYVRSAARLFSLNRLEEIAARIVPYGVRTGAIYRTSNLLIATDYCTDPWFGMHLAPGMWLYDTGLYGLDLPGLYAHVHSVSYSNAALAIFDARRETGENDSRQIRRLPQWSQNTNPLHVQFFDTIAPGNSPPTDVCIFRNAVGQAIATVTRTRTLSGEVASIWRCLWCRNGSYRSTWAEIFPSEAFFLNADLMRQLPINPIHVRLDPFDAKHRTGPNSPWIFTALPSGPISLLKADLSPLHGRDVRVDLDSSAVEVLWKIDAALMSAGVKSTAYTLPTRGDCYQSVAEAAKQAEAGGFSIRGRRAEAIHEVDVVISNPGQPIPGSEIKREMLLGPWLKEGYLAWIYAPEKTGKSWIASAIAQVVASGRGSVGKWAPAKQAGVLLVDGEMLPDELEETIRLVAAGVGPDKIAPAFEVLCARSQPSGVIDIETEEWQLQIGKRLAGKRLLILDNAQSLMGNGGLRLGEVQSWFRQLCRSGIAVLVLDHTNADGELQGSIAKRRIANVVISMKCDGDEAKANGITEVTYEAVRRLHGPEAEPFTLQRIHHEAAVTFEVMGATEPLAEDSLIPERIQKMAKVKHARKNLNLSYRQIEEEFGIPASTASDLLKAFQGVKGEDLKLFKAAMAHLEAEGMRDSDEE